MQAVSSSGHTLLVGAEGHHPSLWDLTSHKQLWQAKGGKPNRVGLVDKPHVTAAAFLPVDEEQSTAENEEAAAETGSGGAAAEGPDTTAAAVEAGARRFVVGIAQGKALLYDITVGKRPQATVAFGDTKVTSVVPEPAGKDDCASGWVMEVAGLLVGVSLRANELCT